MSWLTPPPEPQGEASPAGSPCDGDVTWENFTQGWLRSWCTPCHSSTLPLDQRQGAPEGVDFDDYSRAVAHADAIRMWAVNETAMPPAGGPSSADRARLAEWLDCGTVGSPTTASPCDTAVVTDAESLASLATPCDSGTVIISGDLDTSQGDLDCVCAVDGSIWGSGPVNLPYLERVGGDVDLQDADTFSAPNLREIGGSIIGGQTLRQLETRHLLEVGQDLVLDDVLSLERLDLTLLDRVGGSMSISGPMALDVVTARRLDHVGGHLSLSHLELLHVDGFDSLEFVGGDLVLEDLRGPTSVSSFGDLSEIQGNCRLADLPDVESIDGFISLHMVGALELVDMPSLERIRGFDTLRSTGPLKISALGLSDLEGLDELQTVSALSIELNPSLVLITGLTSLATCSGDLSVVDNPLLPYTEATALASRINVSGDTVIERNSP